MNLWESRVKCCIVVRCVEDIATARLLSKCKRRGTRTGTTGTGRRDHLETTSFSYDKYVADNLKFTLEHVTKAQKGNRDIAVQSV